MKFGLPLILIFACNISATAVPLHRSYKKHNPQHDAMYGVILEHQATSLAANKTTGTQKRVIANSYTVNGVLSDTNHYYYSGGKGSLNTTVTSYYDDFYITAIEPVKTIFCDSSVNWHEYSGNMLRTGSRHYIYNTNNSISLMTNRSYSTTSIHTPTYNNQGKYETITTMDTMGGIPTIPKLRSYAFYDVQNKRLMDSTYSLIANKPHGKRVYTYDANGNRLRFDSYEYSTGTWQLSYRNINTYDGNNRLTTSTAEIDFGMGNGLELTNKDSFAYTGSNTQPSYHIDYDWDNGTSSWTNNEIILNQYNSAGLLDTYYIVRYTTQWDTIERDVHTYDANGLLLVSNGYLYTGNGVFSTTPYDQSTQYYEDYFPTAINTTLANDENMRIYPNPTSGIINIQSLDAQTGSVSVYNTIGQRIFNSTGGQINRQVIDIRRYPAGNYIIHITDDTGRQLYRQQISKL